MLKTRNILMSFLTVLAILALVSGTAFAADKPEVKAFNGESWLLGYLNPGTSTTSDGIVHTQNQVVLVYYDSSDSRVSGYYRGVLNSTMDAQGSGHMWGVIESADENGNPIEGWTGRITGQIYRVYPSYSSLIKGVYQGTGPNKGLRVEVTEAWDAYYMPQPAIIVGLIQDVGK